MLTLFRQARDVEMFAAGELIFAEGETGSLMYIVQSGEVMIVRHGEELDVIGPDGVIGDLAVVDGQPRSASVFAKTDCTLVPINAQRFQFLVRETPFFAAHMQHCLTERLRSTQLSETPPRPLQ